MFLCPFLAACNRAPKSSGPQGTLPCAVWYGCPGSTPGRSTRPNTCADVRVRGSHHVKEGVAIGVDTGQELRALVERLLNIFGLPKLDRPEQLLRLLWLIHGRHLLL